MIVTGTDPNAGIIAEFRANEGRVGGYFAGALMVLMHHVGRHSGKQYVSPVVGLQTREDDSTIYVFASKAGAPDNPAWYYNLTSAGVATVEVGTQTYPVTVTELTGEQRDRIYAEQARLRPQFGDYEQKTAGIRKIPVLALRRESVTG